jgi:hypothetical protein
MPMNDSNRQAWTRLEEHVREVLNSGSLWKNLDYRDTEAMKELYGEWRILMGQMAGILWPRQKPSISIIDEWVIVGKCPHCKKSEKSFAKGLDLEKVKIEFNQKHIDCTATKVRDYGET